MPLRHSHCKSNILKTAAPTMPMTMPPCPAGPAINLTITSGAGMAWHYYDLYHGTELPAQTGAATRKGALPSRAAPFCLCAVEQPRLIERACPPLP